MHGIAADSGPLLALFNQRDAWHKRVYAWIKANPGARLYTTWPVITEVCALLASRVSDAAAHDFLTWISRGGVTLDRPAAPNPAFDARTPDPGTSSAPWRVYNIGN